MKKILTILLCAWSLLQCASCIDELEVPCKGGDDGYVELTLSLYVPGGALTRAYDDVPNEDDIALQRYIDSDDIYVLICDADGVMKGLPEFEALQGQQGSNRRLLQTKLEKSDESVRFYILANVAQACTEYSSSADVRQALLDLIGEGKTWADLCNEFSFDAFGSDGVWKLTESSGYLPMHSDITGEFPLSEDLSISVPMYRSLAKIAVEYEPEEAQAAEFEINNVSIVNQHNIGAFTSPHTPNLDIAIQYEEPYIPASAQLRSNAVKYAVSKNQIINSIFVPEHENNGFDTDMKIQIDATLLDGTKKTYDVYFTDDCLETGKPFNVVRNHSYIFRVKKVHEDWLDVVVEDYTEITMMAVTAQYTLTVSHSSFNFTGTPAEGLELDVWTDGTPWHIEYGIDEEDPSDRYETAESAATTNIGDLYDGYVYNAGDKWVHLDEQKHEATSGKIVITPKANIYYFDPVTHQLKGDKRETYFYIVAGQVRKKIYITQNLVETANSYLITSPGEYELKADVRGNTVTEGQSGEDVSFGLSGSNGQKAQIDEANEVRIIWETVAGLVTIKDKYQTPNPITGAIKYTVHDKNDHYDGQSVFSAGHGGNALIGVFEKDTNKLLWTWHIWICADYKDEVKVNPWKSDGESFNMMDRYLGAYSNQPGPRAYGLLYQWGRKDPFIGPWRDITSQTEEEYRKFWKVPKQHTVHYSHNVPIGNKEYKWMNWNEDAEVSSEESIPNTILGPTTLMRDGLLDKADKKTWALWGTSSGAINVPDAGWKTMWDPCPAGYRVPSVHCMNFTSGSESVYNKTYRYNCEFVPMPEHLSGNWGTGTSQGYKDDTKQDFHSDAPFYGFWVNFKNSRPAESKRNPIGIYYSKDNPGGYVVNGISADFQWLQIGGVYDGNIHAFGYCGTGFGTVDYTPDGYRAPEYISKYYDEDFQGTQYKSGGTAFVKMSSIHVNGLIWLNCPNQSSIDEGDARPAGFYLHGTEGRYLPQQWNGKGSNNPRWLDVDIDENTGVSSYYLFTTNKYMTTVQGIDGNNHSNRITGESNYRDYSGAYVASGRHFHNLNQSGKGYGRTTGIELYAHTAAAAPIIPVADSRATIIPSIGVSSETCNLTRWNGRKTTIEVQGNEPWMVITTGAPWLEVTPLRGDSGKTITINRALGSTDTGTATIVIRFLHSNVERTIKVTCN